MLYTIANTCGMKALITNTGASLIKLEVPNKSGELIDVVLGYEDEASYLHNAPFLGGTVGRYGNRIGGASFELLGERYELAKNDGENNVHSGPDFWHEREWTLEEEGPSKLVFSLTSPDGDQGFPGEVKAYASYELTNEGALDLRFWATSNKATIINLANHSYFNLNGHKSGSILSHQLEIDAESYLVGGATNPLPTGEVRSVADSPFDFRELRAIDAAMPDGGFDHNYCVKGPGTYRKLARLVGDVSGIVMDVLSDAPGMQFYSGGGLSCDGAKDGGSYSPTDGLCLETQFYPDSINHPEWAQPVLLPGERYESHTSYLFSC